VNSVNNFRVFAIAQYGNENCISMISSNYRTDHDDTFLRVKAATAFSAS